MALFKHILDFKRTALARLRDKRKATRYSVGPAFPLKASIVLTDSDGMSRVSEEPPPPGIGRNWGGSLFNLSSEGLSLQLPPAAIARRGEQTFATLSLEGYELKLPCKVAHFRVQGGTAYCGLALDFPNQTLRKSYVQLLEAVALGSTLAPATGGRTSRARPGLRAERYKSARPALLTAWRDAGGRLVSFELVLRDHCLRGEAKRPALEVFSNQAEGEKTAWSAPGFAVSNGVENGEVRQLFRWVALNTSRSVPADLREMMHFFAHARSDWKAPAKPR